MKTTNVSQCCKSKQRELHSAVGRILDALSKSSKAAKSQQLAGYLQGRCGITEAQINRRSGKFEDLDKKSSGSREGVMESVAAEVHDLLDDAQHGPAVDVALIAGKHGIERTMIAKSSTAISYPKALVNPKNVALPKQRLNEENTSAKGASSHLPSLLKNVTTSL